MTKRLNKDTFIPRAIEIHGDKYDYSKTEYIKAKEPVIIICKKHGEFRQRPQDHILKSCGCPKCKTDKIIETHSYTKEKFLELANNKHDFKYDYSEMDYINYSTNIKIICPIHGEYFLNPRDHISGTGCPKCGRELANKSETLSKDDFISRSNKVHFNKYDYSEVLYINNSTKVSIICPDHGLFLLTPANHMLGLGCPKCRLVGLTRLYNRLKSAFPNLKIVFEADKSVVPWIGNQRLDIYIPSINFAVELMGPQHFKEIPYFSNGSSLEITLERDSRKRLKCLENKCILRELDYYYTKLDLDDLIEEVTKKLEELAKDGSDEAAIEAGKLLVLEILYNTIDNTNNLL